MSRFSWITGSLVSTVIALGAYPLAGAVVGIGWAWLGRRRLAGWPTLLLIALALIGLVYWLAWLPGLYTIDSSPVPLRSRAFPI